MDYRRAAQIAEWLLAALVVVLHLGIFLWPETRGQPQFLLMSAHDAQLFSGVVLILAWTILGPGRWWLRLGALPMLLVLWSLPWNTRMIPREPRTNLPGLVALMAAVAIVVTRLCGFRIQRVPAAATERAAQFSLLGLLVVTTLVAAAIGGLEALRPTIAQGQSGDFEVLTEWITASTTRVSSPTRWSPRLVREAVIAAALAMSAIGGLWVVARPGGVWFRLGAVAAAVPILAIYLTNLAGVTDERTTVTVNLGIGLACVAALAGLSVLPLRMFDFRLLRRSASAAAAPAQGGATRSRFLSRAAALAVLAAVGGGVLVSNRFFQTNPPRLQSPASAFAHWVSPPQPIFWLDYRWPTSYRAQVRQRLYMEQIKLLEQSGWEVRSDQILSPPVPDLEPAPPAEPARKDQP